MIEVIKTPKQQECITGCETITITYTLNGEDSQTVNAEFIDEEYRIIDFLFGNDLVINYEDGEWHVFYNFSLQAYLETSESCPFGDYTIQIESIFESFIIENFCFDSNWQAVHHPIKWKLQRKDGIVFEKTVVSGQTSIQLTETLPDGVVLGTFVEYYQPDGTILNGFIVVIGSDRFRLNTASTGTVSGGFVIFPQLYNNYYIETSVLENGTTEIGTLRTIPNSIGLAFVDVHRVLKTKALFENNYNYTSLTAIDAGLSGKYKLKFRENYNFTQQPYGDLTSFEYWSNSAKQIRDLYGSNMAEYVTNIYIPCKFLSVFERPTNFIGYPFSLSYIISGNFAKQIRKNENSGSYTFLTTTTLNTGAVNRLKVSDTANTILIEYGIPDGFGGFIKQGNLTETKEIKINNECLLNAVCLSWLNTLGGREHWVFKYNQIHSIDTSIGATFEPYIQDLETERSNIFDLQRFEQPKITLGASVDIEDIKGLKTILSSICVEIETTNGWVAVRPETGSFKVYESNGTTSDIEFTIQLPYTNIQSR
jgi:hypothetical protein